MAIEYNGELNCSLPVKDLDGAIKWYGDALGFTLSSRVDAIGWAVLTTPVAGVVLGLSTQGREPGSGGASLTFGVRGIEAARASLEAGEVRLDGPINVIPGVVKLQGFFDPEGNALTFWAPPD